MHKQFVIRAAASTVVRDCWIRQGEVQVIQEANLSGAPAHLTSKLGTSIQQNTITLPLTEKTDRIAIEKYCGILWHKGDQSMDLAMYTA